ncbi:hypothetical protein G7046_g6353 [Stylonectria norvegica]|nr:hypothetical protein G7046_g6353 [Stylonectria norvegica]
MPPGSTRPAQFIRMSHLHFAYRTKFYRRHNKASPVTIEEVHLHQMIGRGNARQQRYGDNDTQQRRYASPQNVGVCGRNFIGARQQVTHHSASQRIFNRVHVRILLNKVL